MRSGFVVVAVFGVLLIEFCLHRIHCVMGKDDSLFWYIIIMRLTVHYIMR